MTSPQTVGIGAYCNLDYAPDVPGAQVRWIMEWVKRLFFGSKPKSPAKQLDKVDAWAAVRDMILVFATPQLIVAVLTKLDAVTFPGNWEPAVEALTAILLVAARRWAKDYTPTENET